MSCCGGGGLGIGTREMRVLQWNPQPNTTTAPLADGVPAPTASGTATARGVTAGGALGETFARLGYVSAAAINSVAGGRSANTTHVNGQAVQPPAVFRGGRWAALLDIMITDAVLNPEAKMFVGWSNATAAPTAVDPATLTDMIGIGCDSNENTLRFYSRDNAGAVNEQNLGASFPIAINELYRLIVRCDALQVAGTQDFSWRLIRANTGDIVSGNVGPTVGLNAPRAVIGMSPRFWRATGPANANAVGIDLLWMKAKVEL